VFDFIESLLQKFTTPQIGYQSSFLPSLPVTEKMREKLDKEYLDFVAQIFLIAQKSEDMKRENQLWFSEEIAWALKQAYPNLSLGEYEAVLQQIIDEEKK
jgi:hypothetical protein